MSAFGGKADLIRSPVENPLSVRTARGPPYPTVLPNGSVIPARLPAQGAERISVAGANGVEDGTRIRDLLNKIMTPSQIAEAQKLAREWWAKHPKKK